MGEKGSGGCIGGDSPPEGDHVDDPTDDVMAENGEIPDDLSPVDRIPPKDPLPLSLPLTKKPSPIEREKGSRVSSRVGRLPSTTSIAGVTLSPGGVVSPSMTTPTSSPRKGKKEDGWKEVGKRYMHNYTCTCIHIHEREQIVYTYVHARVHVYCT